MQNKPIRSCVVCRQRFEQDLLIRLQCKDGKIVAFNHTGRSFYICNSCLLSPKLAKQVARNCRFKNTDLNNLAQTIKEIVH